MLQWPKLVQYAYLISVLLKTYLITYSTHVMNEIRRLSFCLHMGKWCVNSTKLRTMLSLVKGICALYSKLSR